jgi:hypothetical protein
MASKYISKHARSQSPNAARHSLDHSLQVYLPTHTITASKFTWFQPPRSSPNLLVQSLKVYLHSRTITATKCIFTLTQWQPRGAFANSLDHYLPLHPSVRSTKMWWIGGAESQTANHEHSARLPMVPESNSWDCGSGSRNVGRGRENMTEYPAMKNHTYCTNLWILHNSAWGTKAIVWIDESSASVGETVQWEGWSNHMVKCDDVYLPQSLPDIYSWSWSLSPNLNTSIYWEI